MIECTIPEGELEESDLAREDPKSQYVIHVDGSSNTNGSRVGLILTSPKRDIIQYALLFEFSSINDKVEYEALIVSLKISKELGVQHLKACSDSQLLIARCWSHVE